MPLCHTCHIQSRLSQRSESDNSQLWVPRRVGLLLYCEAAPSSPGSASLCSCHGAQASVEVEHTVVCIFVIDQEEGCVRNFARPSKPPCRNAAYEPRPMRLFYSWKWGKAKDVATATSVQCTVSRAIAFLFLNTPMRQHAGRLWQFVLIVPFFFATSWLSGSHNKGRTATRDDWGVYRWSVSFGAGGHNAEYKRKESK